MKKIFYLLINLLIINCTSQKQLSHLPTINKNSEKFNKERLSQIIQLNKRTTKSKEYFTTQRKNLLIIKNSIGEELINYTKSNDDNSGFSGYDYSENPIIGVFRQFYSNNNIKSKGIFCWFGFKIGKWYNYDVNGNLISTHNFDKDFDFTYEDVFKYCKKNNISLEKKEENHTDIIKYLSPDLKESFWGIRYRSKEKSVYINIRLDSKSGKEIVRTESPFTYKE